MKKIFAIMTVIAAMSIVLSGCNKSEDAGGTGGAPKAGDAKGGETK